MALANVEKLNTQPSKQALEGVPGAQEEADESWEESWEEEFEEEETETAQSLKQEVLEVINQVPQSAAHMSQATNLRPLASPVDKEERGHAVKSPQPDINNQKVDKK